MADDEAQQPETPEPEPPDQLPSEADPGLAVWEERSGGEPDDAERR